MILLLSSSFAALQPLPHEENVPPATNYEYDTKKKHVSAYYAGKYLPGDVHPFSNITVLDPWNEDEDDHCCDGDNVWPGRSKAFGSTSHRPCENWWWACGYSDSKIRDSQAPETPGPISNDVAQKWHWCRFWSYKALYYLLHNHFVGMSLRGIDSGDCRQSYIYPTQ
jgi:hypothetical protein